VGPEVEYVLQGIELFNRRDLGAVLALCAEDAEIDPSAAVSEPRGYRGRAEIGQFYDSIDDFFTRFHVSPRRIFVLAGGEVAVQVEVDCTERESGDRHVHEEVNVWRLDGGLVKRLEIFFDEDDALEALELETWPAAAWEA
jgi:hypothetical protein